MQLSQRLSDIHPDKLLGTLQQHADSGHEQAALQAIPDLQQQYPEMAAELEQIKGKLSDKLLDHVKVLNPEQAKIFRCANCGAGLARQHPDTVHIICHYCGCDAEHPATESGLNRWNQALDLEARFTIGDMLELDGERWQAVGVQLYSGEIREWDGEDSTWERSAARYTSWWMLNENRELRWLVDDGSNRYWAEKYIPDDPKLPDPNDRTWEHGEWSLQFAAGEFTYQPAMHDRHRSAEFGMRQSGKGEQAGQRFYISVESQLDETGKVKEVEFIRSRPLTDKVMLKALARGSELGDMRRWANTAKAFIATLFLLLGSYWFFDRGDVPQLATASLNSASTDVPVQQFRIEDGGVNMKFYSSIRTIQRNSWFGVEMTIEDSDGQEIYDKYIEFWHETGRDADGPWSESDLASSWYVRFDEPGNYQLFASADINSTAPSADLILKTERGKVTVTPFVVAGFVSMLLMLLSRGKSSSLASAAASIALKLGPRRTEPKSARANSIGRSSHGIDNGSHGQ
jgi:hypothetical protein